MAKEKTGRVLPFDSAAVIDRTKELLGITYDNEMATLVGVSNQVVSNWRARDNADFRLILGVIVERVAEANIRWVLTGEGPPRLVIRSGEVREVNVDLVAPVIIERIEDLVALLKQTTINGALPSMREETQHGVPHKEREG